jgi:hypothetical protein
MKRISKKDKEDTYKRNDLRVTIPLSYENPHIHTLQRSYNIGEPTITRYKNDIVKKIFPRNSLGRRRFKNEIAAYELLKDEKFILPIFDIDYTNLSFAMCYTKRIVLSLHMLNKYNEIYNILYKKYGIEYRGECPSCNIRHNGDLLYIVGFSKIPIRYIITNEWRYTAPVNKSKIKNTTKFEYT